MPMKVGVRPFAGRASVANGTVVRGERRKEECGEAKRSL